MTIADLPYRLRHAAGKLLAGVPVRGESVWPEADNDLFRAHASIYRFFCGSCAGRRVLDAGCGAGYGAAMLAEAGAAEVLAVDLEPRNVRYARRCSAHPKVRYETADLERLDRLELPDGSFDLVVSSNVLEHLERPERFLGEARRLLTPGGEMLLVMPPITSDGHRRLNEANPFHRSNLTVDDWLALFADHGWTADLYRHTYEGPGRLDFASPRPSRTRLEDFRFTPASRDEVYREGSLSGVYRLAPAACGISGARKESDAWETSSTPRR